MPVVIGGDNLPFPVGIWLIDLPKIEVASTLYHSYMEIKLCMHATYMPPTSQVSIKVTKSQQICISVKK